MMKKIKVWDSFIRGYHWLMVLLIATLYISAQLGNLNVHFLAGYLLLALIIARLIWGIFGSDTARFTHFIKSPTHLVTYVKTFFQKSNPPHIGHNPGGAYMVLLFFVLIIIQLSTGIFATGSVSDAPLAHLLSSKLSEKIASFHRMHASILMVAIILHVVVILFYRFYKRQNLIQIMIKGEMEMEVDATRSIVPPKMSMAWLPWVITIIAFAIIYYFWGSYP